MKASARLKLALLLALSLLAMTAQAQVLAPALPEDKVSTDDSTQRYARPVVSSDEAMASFQNGDMKTAYNDFFRLAPSGDPEAEFYLAYMMDKGLGTGKDAFSAVSWYKKAAEQNYLPAVAYMGYVYDAGHGVNKDAKEAVKWYTKAAQMGSADAQNALGTMLRDGRGYKKDYQLADQWFLQAASQGNARAQSNLAAMYYLGHGVKANIPEAMHWYNLAAQQRDVFALSALGGMYRSGEGVNKDPAMALQYYGLAAQLGHLPAELALASMYEIGEGDSTKGPTDAAVWYARAAKKGNPEAETRLGYFDENGIGLPQDIPGAINWYSKAIDEKRYMPAMMALGSLYERGKGKLLPPDPVKAMFQYKRCALAGEPDALMKMGEFYRDGRGVTKDLIEAYQWFALAANAFPTGEDKNKAVVARIETSNAMSEQQLSLARQRVNAWKPIPIEMQY